MYRAFLLATLLLGSCQSTIPNQDLVGSVFPQVTGASLEGETIKIPNPEWEGLSVLLIGYQQDAQFDADRWLLGLLQTETPARILEVPTIPGLFVGLMQQTIDDGMRRGIPYEDWGTVVTLYGEDAEVVRTFTGDARSNNMQVILLDESGVVRWAHHRGYSAREMLHLDEKVRSILGLTPGQE